MKLLHRLRSAKNITSASPSFRGSSAPAAAVQRLPFKVYVYELPLWSNTKILKRNPWCTESAFGTEQYIHQQFLNSRYNIRTHDPNAADYFYVPIYATCLLYRDFGFFDHYRYLVKEVLNHIITAHPYWNRTRGRDHIWPFVHDFGGCLSWLDNTDHIYFNELRNSIFLSHLGDLAMGCFQSYKDIVIPPMVTDTTLYRDGQGGIDTDPANRHIFAHFRGTVNWYHGNRMKQLYIEKGYSKLYSHGVRQGFAPWSRRLFDSVMMGCIPVIIADNIELPFEQFLDYRSFTVKVAEEDVSRLKEILVSIPPEVIRQKQEMLKKVWVHFTYQRPSRTGDAFHMILRKLSQLHQRLHPIGGDSWQ
eukprot:g3430.t1